MGYLKYIFDLFYNIANTIKIPIPISENVIIQLSIFSILVGCIVLGSIIWFIARFSNFELNWAFGQLGRSQSESFKTNNSKSTDKEYSRSLKGKEK